MPRPSRLRYPGACYHVTNRGRNQEAIFMCDEDRLYFLKLLRACVETYRLDVHVYCLMKSEFHIIMTVHDLNMGAIMRDLQSKYSVYFNRKYGRSGSLYAGRYRSVLLLPLENLLNVSRYVHSLPVSQGVVRQAEDYSWSSCAFYTSVTPPKWIKIDKVLDNIQSSSRNKHYRIYVNLPLDYETRSFYEKRRRPNMMPVRPVGSSKHLRVS